jgi:oligopeptide transport system substrate-binding protein
MKSIFLAICMVFATSIGAASASTKLTSPAQSAPSRSLAVRLIDPPVNLDWTGLATILEAPLIINLSEGLFTYEYPGGKLIPGLAASLQKSKDLTEYTFKIRDDAKWSDGRPVYAQDFVDAWVRTLSPQSTSIYTYYLFDILNAQEYNQKKVADISSLGFKAIDDRTLRVKLKHPMKNWESYTAFWPMFPVRQDQIEKYGSNWWHAGVLISSGPFVFDSYEAGKSAVLKRNPYYKRFHSNVEQIVFTLADQDEALKKYQAGFFDFLWGMPFSLTKSFKGKSDYKNITILRGHLLGLNTQKYPMSNREFRLAILSALDPKKLIPENADQLYVGQTLIPPPLPGSKKSVLLHYDPVAAREHLKKSGIVLGKSAQVRLLTSMTEPFQAISRLIQAQLNQNLGFNVDLAAPQNQEYTTYLNLGDYNATLLTWTAKVVSPQDFLLPYSGQATFNRMHFKDPAFDEWISAGVEAGTSAAAQEAFFQAQKVLTQDDAVLIPLFFERNSTLIRQNIKGLYFNQMGIPVLKDVEISGK